MNVLQIAVCDDNQTMRESLRALLQKYFDKKSIRATIREFSSGEQLLSHNDIFDIAFLDVEMKEINGIQTGYELQKRNNDICIFVITAFNRYLDDAMDLRVFRYLEKPVNEQRLYKALDIATRPKNIIKFMSDYTEVEVDEENLVCVYSHERKTFVMSSSGRSLPTAMSIAQWTKKIGESKLFSMPHYSYIVNLKYVTGIDGNTISIKCKNGYSFTIYASQRKIAGFKKAFYEKMRENR